MLTEVRLKSSSPVIRCLADRKTRAEHKRVGPPSQLRGTASLANRERRRNGVVAMQPRERLQMLERNEQLELLEPPFKDGSDITECPDKHSPH